MKKCVYFLSTGFVFVITLFLLILPVKSFSQIEFHQYGIIKNYQQGSDIDVMDMNNDGLLDIISVATEHNNSVSWWENQGYNMFEEHIIDENMESHCRYVTAVDIDFDQDADVIVAVIYSNDIIWYQNDGNQNFTPIIIDSNFRGAHTLDIKDLDDDGDLDVLCSGFDNINGAGEIAWWENEDFNFTKHVISERFQQSPFIYGEDMDGDGDMDVIACGELNGEIYWWQNDGNQNFTELEIDSSFPMAHTVLARDVDQDGDFDILAAACMSSLAAWYENDGSGLFTKHSLGTFTGSIWIDMADFDQDGDMDLAGAGMGAPAIRIWTNDGNQNFSPTYEGGSFSSGFCLKMVDFDNDTDTDIIGLSYNGNKISFFSNDLANPYLINHPECIVYDQERSRYLVSNPSGSETGFITAIDENGFMSYFVEEINNPMGMCIVDDQLYVSDEQDSVLAFNLDTGDKVFSTYMNQTGTIDGQAYDGAQFLYVIDTDGRILKLNIASGNSSVFVSSGLMNYPQDCIFDENNNRLLVVGWSPQAPIMGVDINDSSVYIVKQTSYGYFDGITADQYGNVYVSSHMGAGYVLKFDPGFLNDPEIISSGHLEPAGLNYNTFDDVLAIPNYGSSTLDFINLNITSLGAIKKLNDCKFINVSPNPAKGKVIVRIEVDQPAIIQLELFDISGHQRLEKRSYLRNTGANTVILNTLDIDSGIYFLRLVSDGKITGSKKLIIYK